MNDSFYIYFKDLGFLKSKNKSFFITKNIKEACIFNKPLTYKDIVDNMDHNDKIFFSMIRRFAEEITENDAIIADIII